MTLRELGLDECEDLLRRHRFGRIAMRDAEGAYLVPISYAYEDGAIYAHAAPGRKLTLMRRWPHVALQVDDVQNGATWRSVILQGKFEELMDEEARTKARMLLLRAFAGDPLSATAGHGHRTTLADAVMFRVKAEQITGRAENM